MTHRAVTAASQRASRPHPLVVLVRALVVALLAAAAILGVALAFAPPPAVAATPVPIEAAEPGAASVAWPETARAAGYAVVGVDGAAEAWGSDQAHPMASITKLVTVLVVLDAHPIEGDDRGAEITLGRPDLVALGEALADNAPIAPVYDGMVVTQRDLMEWALVDSAGNAAWSLANWGFGSIDAFLDASAAWAERHGLEQTSLADPIGLSARSVSSAADLTRIGLLAVADPVVLATLQLEEVAIPGIGIAPSTNRILGEGFVDGGKTGTLKVWGRNLFVTAERVVDGEPRRIVAVVMGTIAADETDEAMLTLLDSLWDDFQRRTIVPAGTVVAEFRAPWGATTTASTLSDLDADVFGAQQPTATAEAGAVEPGAPRSEVGQASLTDHDGETSSTPVRADGMLAAPDLAWRLTHPVDVVGWYFD